ncbi:MAG TPA: hypothetical protein VN721_07455 [Flavipsychrobacter sp.]|nr:hypothetical protein [Flavipsychrobacter sp.]
MNLKRTYLFALALAIAIASCSKKSDSPAPSSTSTTTSSHPYYFRFSLDGATDTILGNDDTKGFAYNTNFVSSIIAPSGYSLYPNITINFRLPEDWDTIKESDVLGLAGRTVYFTDTNMGPTIKYAINDSVEWDSYGDSSSYVKVDSVTFKGTDTYTGVPVRTYIMVGSCNTLMTKTFGYNKYLTGTFRMLLVRVTW